jgi:hypothetical protein
MLRGTPEDADLVVIKGTPLLRIGLERIAHDRFTRAPHRAALRRPPAMLPESAERRIRSNRSAVPAAQPKVRLGTSRTVRAREMAQLFDYALTRGLAACG